MTGYLNAAGPSIPKHGADGTAEEIALTSIKVSNFDKTATAVPTYTVFSRPTSGALVRGSRPGSSGIQ